MAWNVTDDPVDFDQAIEWFKKRVPVTKAEFERLSAREKRTAFTVANVAQLDLVHQVWKAIDAALAKGTTLEDFKKSVGDDLKKAWAGTVGDPPWRLETIFRTNVQGSYGAGRYRQAKDPDVENDRPIWMFDAVLDSRTTPICRDCDGTKLPNDDAWWATHTAPLHFNCRSGFIALTAKQAGKITLVKPTVKPQDGFGLAPGDEEFAPNAAKYPTQLLLPFNAKQAAAPPPPPPSEMKLGVHVKRFVSPAGKAKGEALLKSVDDAALLKWLEQNPLERLGVRRQASSGRTSVNGWYAPAARVIEVTADRKAGTFGASFVAGSSHSISTTMPTKEQAAKATLRHELGHHVHLVGGRGSKVDKIIADAYTRARAANTYITKYAGTSHAEYFAESFAAYYLRRSDLKNHDPNGFKMVEDVLRERGMLP